MGAVKKQAEQLHENQDIRIKCLKSPLTSLKLQAYHFFPYLLASLTQRIAALIAQGAAKFT
jgi:hypothetical protein